MYVGMAVIHSASLNISVKQFVYLLHEWNLVPLKYSFILAALEVIRVTDETFLHYTP